LLSAKTEAEVRGRLMDRQGERPQATEPDVIERTRAAPPGVPPPSAPRIADLTEPRPQGGVFDSGGNPKVAGEVGTPGGRPTRVRDKAGGAGPAPSHDTYGAQSGAVSAFSEPSGGLAAHEPASAAVEGEAGIRRRTFGDGDEIVAPAPRRAQPSTRKQTPSDGSSLGDSDKPTDFPDPIKGAHHGAPDALGRPTGIVARITRAMINTGTKASQSIIPPGWRGDGRLFNEARGHLLGRQLGGSGHVAKNLVTLQQNPANSPVMSGFEKEIRRAVEGGQNVRYSSRPVYKGTSVTPRGITLRAKGSGGFYLYVTILNRLRC
jgi:hypothetical protein